MWLNMQSGTRGKAGRGEKSSEEEEEVTAQGEVGGARRTAVSQATERLWSCGPAEVSTLHLQSASQLIRAPPSARGTNKKR